MPKGSLWKPYFRLFPRVKRPVYTCYICNLSFWTAELSLNANTNSPGMRCRPMKGCHAKVFSQCQELVSSPEELYWMGTHLACHPFSLSPRWKYSCALTSAQTLTIVTGFNFKPVHPRTNTCFHLNKGGKGETVRLPRYKVTQKLSFWSHLLSLAKVVCHVSFNSSVANSKTG